MNNYNETISFWNNIFGDQTPKHYNDETRLHEDLEGGIKWLTDGTTNILDYGCGSGAILFRCTANKNISKCLGMDISEKAVELGKATARLNNLDDVVEFCCGGVEELRGIEENCFDGAILSNIVDNITPEDAEVVIENVSRILKPKGKLLLKLNPYLSAEQLDECGCKLIGDNLYEETEGIYLWNCSTSQWKEYIERYFIIEDYKEIHFQQFNQYNRLFLLTKRR
ncbi:class I SAM-dependent methyltransferase [Inconstantimicrobium mannanitabidum]|uniref:Uncharacterized protein n=1 Tax=Inconstantimicrobium mannanitabidum TaxID=1604901 RepID=A0ACB5RGW8_9CLOT|nr:class I SAM-dependent methyltransferase [Clostridium sp. TW13]GKX68335.1 hypothetical protein rsdtw13_35930 [Clostridium sp. TW13]